NVGAGCGVSAGKLLGTRHATKTGLGHAGILSDEGLAIAAAVVLNPVGDVIGSDGAIIAGARSTPDGRAFCNIADVVRAGAKVETQVFNTVLAVVGTNAALTRDEARWVADQAAVAIGRRVDPPFTRHDGDVVFCASVGDFSCDIHRVGLLARDVLSAAIDDAVWSAEPAGGLPSASVIRAGG
ncbi:MAG: P1 family peptidase, partial [Myxococcales bacterium]|nr:P1 family peptidase [Myxococcales bacterium]